MEPGSLNERKHAHFEHRIQHSGLCYVHAFLSGNFDLTASYITSVDTVKTRLQGQPAANPPKYHNMFHAYSTILREEGVTRGLYGGVAPAMSGSRKFKSLAHLFPHLLPIRL